MTENDGKMVVDTSRVKTMDTVDKPIFESHIIEVEGYQVITPSGEIDIYSAPQFRQDVVTILDGFDQDLIIDMHNVTYVDSSGFSILISALKRLAPNGRTINLVGCTPTTEHILHLTRIAGILTLYQNMEDCIKALSEE